MNSLLAALINGTILSGVAAAVLWAALRLAPRRVLNAATRYVAWWAALIVAAVFPALFLAGSSRPAPATLTAIRTSLAAVPPEAVGGSDLASGGGHEEYLPQSGAAAPQLPVSTPVAANTEKIAGAGLVSGRQVEDPPHGACLRPAFRSRFRPASGPAGSP